MTAATLAAFGLPSTGRTCPASNSLTPYIEHRASGKVYPASGRGWSDESQGRHGLKRVTVAAAQRRSTVALTEEATMRKIVAGLAISLDGVVPCG
jgi:hypothetical protein